MAEACLAAAALRKALATIADPKVIETVRGFYKGEASGDCVTGVDFGKTFAVTKTMRDPAKFLPVKARTGLVRR